jgi:hypothetical protein
MTGGEPVGRQSRQSDGDEENQDGSMRIHVCGSFPGQFVFGRLMIPPPSERFCHERGVFLVTIVILRRFRRQPISLWGIEQVGRKEKPL